MKYIFTQLAMLAVISFYMETVYAQTCKDNVPASTKNHFFDNGNGTITDISTSLIWKKCSEGQSWNRGTNSCDQTAATYTWEKALLLSRNPDEKLGQSHWRIPNIKELYSLLEISCYTPSIDSSFFPNTPSNPYWSSSPNNEGVWVLHFDYGNSSFKSRGDTGRAGSEDGFSQVRLVTDK